MTWEAYTFSLDGQTITVDLTPYGQAGAQMGTRERAERAATLVNELTVLKARLTSAHNRLKAQLFTELQYAAQGSTAKITKSAIEEQLHRDGRYIGSREVLDFVESAWEVMVRVHCPRLKDLDSSSTFGSRAGASAQPPAFFYQQT